MKTTPQLRGGAFVGQGSAHGTRCHNSHRAPGIRVEMLASSFPFQTPNPGYRGVLPSAASAARRTLGAGDPRGAPAPCPSQCSSRCPAHHADQCTSSCFSTEAPQPGRPRARSCPEWVSPVPALCPAGPAGAVAPSPSAWLGRSFFWPLLPSSGI